MGQEITEKVVELGKKYSELKDLLADLKFLTSPSFSAEAMDALGFIRAEMVSIGAAFKLEDNSIIIKSDYIIAFLEPNLPRISLSKRAPPNLKDPAVVEKIALSCGLSQWVFLASQLETDAEREEFLKTCARIVGQQAKKNN